MLNGMEDFTPPGLIFKPLLLGNEECASAVLRILRKVARPLDDFQTSITLATTRVPLHGDAFPGMPPTTSFHRHSVQHWRYCYRGDVDLAKLTQEVPCLIFPGGYVDFEWDPPVLEL